MYADDLKLYTVNDPPALQLAIQTIHAWSQAWNLDINKDKTSVMLLGRQHPPHSFTLDGSPITACSDFQDLGVRYNNSLNFDIHIASIISKSHARSNYILKSFSTRKVRTLYRLFCCYVRPIIEYASEVWNPSSTAQVRALEAVQRRFTKRCFDRIGRTDLSYDQRLTTLDAQSLSTRRQVSGLSFMYKLAHTDVSVPFSSLFTISNRSNVSRFHQFVVIPPRCNTIAFKASFIVRYVEFWNRLPREILMSSSSFSFKRKVIKRLGLI